jgi:hypothetical protein
LKCTTGSARHEEKRRAWWRERKVKRKMEKGGSDASRLGG